MVAVLLLHPGELHTQRRSVHHVRGTVEGSLSVALTLECDMRPLLRTPHCVKISEMAELQEMAAQLLVGAGFDASDPESGRTLFCASGRALSRRWCWHDGHRALVLRRRWERCSSTRRAALGAAPWLELQGSVSEDELAFLQSSLDRALLMEMSKGVTSERLGHVDARCLSELGRESARQLLRHAIRVRLQPVEVPDEDARHLSRRRCW